MVFLKNQEWYVVDKPYQGWWLLTIHHVGCDQVGVCVDAIISVHALQGLLAVLCKGSANVIVLAVMPRRQHQHSNLQPQCKSHTTTTTLNFTFNLLQCSSKLNALLSVENFFLMMACLAMFERLTLVMHNEGTKSCWTKAVQMSPKSGSLTGSRPCTSPTSQACLKVPIMCQVWSLQWKSGCTCCYLSLRAQLENSSRGALTRVVEANVPACFESRLAIWIWQFPHLHNKAPGSHQLSNLAAHCRLASYQPADTSKKM